MDVDSLSLRIVPLDQVVLHEGVELRRLANLKEKLQHDGFLQNPAVVAPAGDRYVVLDGATRTEALRSLGFPSILVQVVDATDPNLQVYTWHHLLTGLDAAALKQDISKIKGVKIEDIPEEEARSLLAQRAIAAYLVLGNGDVWAVWGGSGLPSQVTILNRLVDTYRGKSDIFREVTTELETLLQKHERITAIVVFPQYTVFEILDLATRELKLPTGITRFIIPGRVLRVNLDLEVLRSPEPLEEKNRWLQDYIMEALRQKKIRYYQEPVFLFED